MTYKLIVCGPLMNGPIWGIKFYSRIAAEAAKNWIRGKGYDVEIFNDDASRDPDEPE